MKTLSYLKPMFTIAFIVHYKNKWEKYPFQDFLAQEYEGKLFRKEIKQRKMIYLNLQLEAPTFSCSKSYEICTKLLQWYY